MLRSNSGKSWSSKEAKKESAIEFYKLFKDNFTEAKKMWKYCRKWSKTVEIFYRPKHDTDTEMPKHDTVIQTQAYFPYNPHVSYLSWLHLLNNFFVTTDTFK